MIRYYIMQYKTMDRDVAFLGTEELKRMGMPLPSIVDYRLVYCGVESGNKVDLEDVFYRFNMAHPENFYGHSLSVGDVVVVMYESEPKAFFVDSFGFAPLPEFFYDSDTVLGDVSYVLRTADGYLRIQVTDEGLDYTKYDLRMVELDGGVYDDVSSPYLLSLHEILQSEYFPSREFGVIREEQEDDILSKIESVDAVSLSAKTARRFLHEKSKDLFRPVADFGAEELEDAFSVHAAGVVEDCGLPVTILDSAVYGSRSIGAEHDSSDLDVLVFYVGDVEEDAFFNILNETPLHIANVKVDFNPIRFEESGDFYEYLKKPDAYLSKKE